MKKIKLLAAAALIITMCSNSSVVFAEGNVFDVDAAINSALKNSYTIKAQQYSLDLAQNSCDQAQEASDNANSKLVQDESNRERIDELEEEIDAAKTEEEKEEKEAEISSIKRTLLTQDQKYQLIKTRDIGPLEAKYNLMVANNNKEVAENTLKYNIYTQYDGLINLKDTMDTEQKNVNNLLDTYNSSKLKLDLGVISSIDAKKSEASYLNEKPVLVKEQRNMEISQMTINNTIGEDISKRYDTFSKDILGDGTNIKTLDEYLKDALKNRYELVKLQEYVNLKNQINDLSESKYYDEEELNNQQTKYDLQKAQSDLELEKLSIQQEITESYNSLVNKAKKIEYAKKDYEAAKKSYDKSQKKYELGLISKIDLNTAEIAFKLVEYKLKVAERDFWLAQLKMEYQCGKGINSTS